MAQHPGNDKLARIAQVTVEATERGFYTNQQGHKKSVRRGNSTLYTPENLAKMRQDSSGTSCVSLISHRTESTLVAASYDSKIARTLVLNFASGTRPGGGFLRGTQAQEESIARSSALYNSLLEQPAYYIENQKAGAPLYTDHMILSRDVSVFRDDYGNWLLDPYKISILTVPAPNCSVFKTIEECHREDVVETIRRRAFNICMIAWFEGYETLILGAWGCGVFRNDPEVVALAFQSALRRYSFGKVVFAIPAGNERTANIFKEVIK